MGTLAPLFGNRPPPAATPRNRFAAAPVNTTYLLNPNSGQAPLANLRPEQFTNTGNNSTGGSFQLTKHSQTGVADKWTPPTLDANGRFTSQQDIDDFKAVIGNSGYGIMSSGATQGPASDPLAVTNNKLAREWGHAHGFWNDPPGGHGGIRGALKDFGDAAVGFTKNVILTPPVLAAATAGIGAALGAGAGTAGAGAGQAAGTAIEDTAGFAAANSSQAINAITGVTPSATSTLAADLSAGGYLSGAALGGAATSEALLGGPMDAGQGALGPTQAGVEAQPGAQAAQAAPSSLGATDAGQGVMGPVGPGGAGSGGTGDLIGSPAALDPSGAPVSEAPVDYSAANDALRAPAPGGSANGDMIGKIGAFAKDAISIGGLLGGLASLSARSGSVGEPPAPPPSPTPTEIPSQEGIKADVAGSMQPGGPDAGISSTWLTGASGVPEDQLRLGRQTLLGK